eukprot:6213804-Pleurochrysis_carterae.AAC.2
MQCPRTCDRHDVCCVRAFCRSRFGACMGPQERPSPPAKREEGGNIPNVVHTRRFRLPQIDGQRQLAVLMKQLVAHRAAEFAGQKGVWRSVATREQAEDLVEAAQWEGEGRQLTGGLRRDRERRDLDDVELLAGAVRDRRERLAVTRRARAPAAEAFAGETRPSVSDARGVGEQLGAVAFDRRCRLDRGRAASIVRVAKAPVRVREMAAGAANVDVVVAFADMDYEVGSPVQERAPGRRDVEGRGWPRGCHRRWPGGRRPTRRWRRGGGRRRRQVDQIGWGGAGWWRKGRRAPATQSPPVVRGALEEAVAWA